VKRVLIAIDYEPSAQKVAEEGYLLGEAMNAHIILLHVISDKRYDYSAVYSPIMGFSGYSFSEDSESVALEKIVRDSYIFLENIKDHLSDNDIETKVVQGSVADSIIEMAEKTNATFIVIGTHSKRKFEDIFMGNVANKVLKISKKPIMLIPTKQE